MINDSMLDLVATLLCFNWNTVFVSMTTECKVQYRASDLDWLTVNLLEGGRALHSHLLVLDITVKGRNFRRPFTKEKGAF